MDDMREIVTLDQVDRLFLLLAVAAPVVGVAIGALLGRRSGNVRRGALAGLLVGLLGPANLALWKVYNGITGALGLDTVRNLLVNLALFVGLGVIAGLVYGYLAGRRQPAAPPPEKSEGV